MTIGQLQSLVEQDLKRVDDLIHEKINCDVNLIDELANHIINSGGKRLRPLIVLLACKACDYNGVHNVTLAAMVEFFHTATLLHDDVIDESKLRRGRKTANEIWGSKISILVGDFLLTRYMQLLIDVNNPEIMQLLTDIAFDIGRGEIQQLDNRHKPEINEEAYFSVIRSKTSLLFAASAKISAILSGASIEVQESLYQYGLHLGNAFQLIDDALDYCSDSNTIGKNIGDDLADGIATLPLIHALKNGSEEQKAKIKVSLEQGILDNLPEIQEAIEQTSAIEYTKQIAQQEVEYSLMALKKIPNSQYKEALATLANYAIKRSY